LALGVDAIAHRATLDTGGTTVAVLGSGIDDETIGPRQNFSLARDILSKGGAIVSEYEPGSPADKWTFPARNRIISGLSRGVVIVEADIKSGALITARHAADQGRDVFAVPGSIFWPRSSGPNSLIQQGAKAVLAPSDILEEYDLEPGPQRTTVSTQDPIQTCIAAILENGPLHADGIIASSGLPASQVMISLSMMELAGTVVRTENGHYRIYKP
jgi:DNA processing protein